MHKIVIEQQKLSYRPFENRRRVGEMVGKGYPILLCVVLAGFVFFYRVSTGSMQPFYIDEMFYDRYAMELAQWLTTSEPIEFSYVHPSGYSLLLAVVFGMYFVVGKLLGQFPDVASFLIHFSTHREDFITLGRLLSGVFALATVPAIYALARRLFNERAALLASFAFVLSYPVIFYAHIAANITMLMFLTAMAMYHIVRVSEQGRVRDYALAGAFIGAAIGTKYYPILLALPLLIAHLYNTGWRAGVRERAQVGKLVIAGAAVVFFAVLMFPLPLLEFKQWSYFFKDTYQFYTGGNVVENAYRLVWGNVPHYEATAAEPSPWWSNSLRSLSESTLAWFGVGLMYGVYRFPRRSLLLASPFVVMFVVQCVKGGLGLGVRQLYFGIPLLLILASAALVNVVESLRLPARWRTPLVVAVGFVLLVQPMMWATRFLSLLSKPTTVELGRAWLLENIPKGSVLLCDGGAAPFGEMEGWWADNSMHTFSANESERLVKDARKRASPFKVLGMKWENAREECELALSVGTPVFVVTTDYFFTHYWHPETLASWGNMGLSVAEKMRNYVTEIMRNSNPIHVIAPREEDAFGPTVTIARMDTWTPR